MLLPGQRGQSLWFSLGKPKGLHKSGGEDRVEEDNEAALKTASGKMRCKGWLQEYI